MHSVVKLTCMPLLGWLREDLSVVVLVFWCHYLYSGQRANLVRGVIRPIFWGGGGGLYSGQANLFLKYKHSKIFLHRGRWMLWRPSPPLPLPLWSPMASPLKVVQLLVLSDKILLMIILTNYSLINQTLFAKCRRAFQLLEKLFIFFRLQIYPNFTKSTAGLFFTTKYFHHQNR